MEALKAKMARMQLDLSSLTADVGQLSGRQASVHAELAVSSTGLEELLSARDDAEVAVAEASAEVERGKVELSEAETEIWRALSRPAPFLTAQVSGASSHCAVVSTLKGIPREELFTWLSHHLDGCGFSRAFLFFDDPSELSCDVLSHWEKRVVAIPADEKLKWKYSSCKRFPDLQDHLEEDWLARQELHVELAMTMAQADGCEWLLHIDLDELFLLPDSVTAPQHFAAVPVDRRAVAYLNHEGVPELGQTCREEQELLLRRNRFAAVSLFRRNPHCFASGYGLDDLLLCGEGIDPTRTRGSTWQRALDGFLQAVKDGKDTAREEAQQARQAFAFWLERTQNFLGSSQYFLAYANGKGAVRLGADCELPNGVHRFGNTDLGLYWTAEEACVLHYAHGSYDAVASKLRRLRASTGSWWQSFVLYVHGRELDGGSMVELYDEVVALHDSPEQAFKQVETGICLRHKVAGHHLPHACLSLLD